MSRTNLALLVAVLVLGGVVVLVEKPWSGKKPEGYVERKALFEDFDPAKIGEIDLQRAEAKLTLHKVGGKWVLKDLGDYPANEGQVNQVIAAVQQWKIDARVGTTKASATYMVDDKTGTRVTLKDEGGKVLADLFTGRVGGFDAKEAARQGGKVDTETFGIYVRRADAQDVYFMKGLFLGTFSPDTSSFMERGFLTFDVAKATQLLAACGDRRLVLTKKDDRWIVEGLSMPPDDDEVKRLPEGFARLSAVSLEGKYEPGKYGLEPPRCVVQATLDDGTLHILEVGSEKEGKGFYARKKDDPFVVVISKYEVEAWQKEPQGFARKRLWADRQMDLSAMTIVREGSTIDLKKVNEQWAIVTKEVGEVEADFNAAWKLVNAITNAEVKEYAGQGGESGFGLAPPRITAKGTTKDGKEVTLLVGRDKSDTEVYAKGSDSSWVVVIPKTVLNDLSVQPADLKKKAPPPPPQT